MSQEVKHMKPIIEQIISIHERCKNSWASRDLNDLEDAIKALKISYEKAGQPGADPDLRDLCKRTYQILKNLSHKYRQHHDSPNVKYPTVVSTIFQLLLSFCSDESLRLILRDTYGIVELLSHYFDPQAPNTDLLHLISKLTHNISVPYKNPTYELLIKKLFTFILGYKPSGPNFSSSNLQHAFNILINLCRNNNSCKLIAKQNDRMKDIFKAFGQPEFQIDKMMETNFLFSHFHFILNSDALSGFSTAFLTVNQFVDLILGSKSPNTSKNLRFAVSFMKSIISKMEAILGSNDEQSTSVSSPHKNEVTCQASEKLVKLILDMLTKLSTYANSLKTFEPAICKTLLEFILVLLPTYLPVSSLTACYKTSLLMTQRLIKDAHKQSTLFVQGLKLYLHVFEPILSINDRNNLQLVKEFEKSIGQVMTKIEIRADASPDSVDSNIVALRFLNCISSYDKFNEEAMKKMDANLIRALVNTLIGSSKELISANERSTQVECLLELLSAMSNFSQNAAMLNLLLQLVSNPDVSYHIANSIQNGNDRAIKNALTVISSTVFSSNSLSSITKSLRSVRQHTPDVTTLESSQNGLEQTEINCNGAIKLEEVLSSVDILNGNGACDKNDNKGSSLGDLVAFYRIKQEFHQHEMATVNAHVIHLNKTIAHLKTLLDRHDEILSKNVLNNEVTNWEVQMAEAKYFKKVQEASSKIALLEKDLDTMKLEVIAKTARLAELEMADKKLEEEVTKLKKALAEETKLRQDAQYKLKQLKDDYKNVKSDNHRMKTDLSDAKTKITNLEVALKREEEEVSNYKISLEKEKRKLDTIRGLVGNNFATGLDD